MKHAKTGCFLIALYFLSNFFCQSVLAVSEASDSSTPTGMVLSTAIEQKGQGQMTTWFLMITVGLLVLIILIQAWPVHKMNISDEGQQKGVNEE